MYGSIPDWGLFMTALFTIGFSFYEYFGYKNKETNKLLSQLNKRYVENENVQKVVKYLRQIEPDKEPPSVYQIELFLRFFEELGLYLDKKSIKPEEVDSFFGYYLKELYQSVKGKELLKKLNKEEEGWKHLNICKEKLGITV